MSKGHCLNSLVETKFDVSMSASINPSASIPKAVKRVHEIFEKPKFMDNVNGCDVKQGGLGDCWLMASFTGLASVPDAIKRICVEYDASKCRASSCCRESSSFTCSPSLFACYRNRYLWF